MQKQSATVLYQQYRALNWGFGNLGSAAGSLVTSSKILSGHTCLLFLVFQVVMIQSSVKHLCSRPVFQQMLGRCHSCHWDSWSRWSTGGLEPGFCLLFSLHIALKESFLPIVPTGTAFPSTGVVFHEVQWSTPSTETGVFNTLGLAKTPHQPQEWSGNGKDRKKSFEKWWAFQVVGYTLLSHVSAEDNIWAK